MDEDGLARRSCVGRPAGSNPWGVLAAQLFEIRDRGEAVRLLQQIRPQLLRDPQIGQLLDFTKAEAALKAANKKRLLALHREAIFGTTTSSELRELDRGSGHARSCCTRPEMLGGHRSRFAVAVQAVGAAR
jgi:hypothetical protein